MKKRSLFLSALLVLSTLFSACSKSSPAPTPPPTPTPPVTPPTTSAVFAKGADVSWTTEMEASGRKFFNATGAEMECMDLLKSLGMNTIRLRVWVNPSPAWNGAADVVAKAVRAKNLGMRVMINFHYSDTWADPGAQGPPAAWTAFDLNGLRSAVTTHTTDILNQLKAANVTPEWVQVGNETNNGMLWPVGRASTGMAAFTQLVNAGYDAVKAVFPTAKVIVHISNGFDNALFRWIFDGLRANGAKYDVIGMSLYPSFQTTNWQTTNTQCYNNMLDMVSRYNKEVMVVEFGMPWDRANECKLILDDLMLKIKAVPDGKGIGLLYWEPQCYGSWKGYTLGAFDNTGKPTIALDAFR